QIEEGTYKRDKLRAERLLQEAQKTAAKPHVAEAQAPAPKEAAPKRTYPEPLRKLHQAYLSARQQTGESANISIEAFAATVQKQYVTIKSRYNCKTVDFQVTTKGGRAILKAIPR